MACKRYTVTVTTTNRSGLVTYVDCNFVTQSRVFRQGSTNEIFAESIGTTSTNVNVVEDTSFIPDLNVEPRSRDLPSDDDAVQAPPSPPIVRTPPPPPPSSLQLRYYQLVPCNNQPVAVYTTRPPSRDNERVSITNASSVGVASNVFFTYNGQSTTSANPGVIASSVFSTGASGCVDTPPPPPPPVRDTFNPINLGFDSVGSSAACFRFNNRTIPITQYYINSTSLQTATRITSDSFGFNTVPDGFYTDGTYFIEVRGGLAQPARLCQNIPPPQDDGGLDIDTPILGPTTIYTLRSCENQNLLRSTDRPPKRSRERIILEDVSNRRREDFVYTGQVGTSTVGFFVSIDPRAVLSYRIIETGESDCVVIPTTLSYTPITSCSTGEKAFIGFTRNFENEQIQIGNELWYFTGPTTTRVPNPGSRIITDVSNVFRTGRQGCDTGVGTEDPPPPPPPAPTTVSCLFESVVSPTLQSAYNALCTNRNLDLSEFSPGEILLDGKVIGVGSISVTLDIGKSYSVEFRKPSHPQFTFTEGTQSRLTFTATSSTTKIDSIFTPSLTSNVGTLTVNTRIVPTVSGKSIPIGIYITGIGKIGENSIQNYKLEPGDYTVYFDSIRIEGSIYLTPQKRKITIKKCETVTIDAIYNGIPLPTNYWLKRIDGSEQLEYNSIITKGMFSNDVANLTSFYTSSISDSLDNHYTHIYESPINSITSSIQFSVAYGHSDGSGSNDEGGQYNDTPTRAIYGQYRNIILGDATSNLNLSGTPTKHFYAISYQKDRRDTKADYNALEINLAHLSGSEFIATSDMRNHTGSNVTLGGLGKVLRLISDSKINDEPQRVVPSAPIEYNIVSGSIEDGVYNQASPHYYGKLYPSLGVVLLDANKLDVSASFGTVTTREVDGKNQLKIFTAISGAAQYTDASGDFLGMKARATKEEIIYYYHINVRNKEFNYTNNPTLYNTQGLQFLQYGVPSNVRISKDFFDNTANIVEDNRAKPKTYITTIGLYDIDRNLIAVAKLSKAEFKSFTDEVMFTVKLKF